MNQSISFDPAAMPDGSAYHMLNAIIAPRPIAWISTIGPNGVFNLAPHSYTTVASQNPPIVCFVSIGRKDTIRNVEATGEFVYNVGNRELVERINRSAADFPRDVSEFEWAGLTPVVGRKVAAPRVAEAPVAMECRLVEVHEVASTNNHIILGEVLAIHVDERLLVNDRIDTALLDPVGRLAGSLYSEMGSVFSLERPTWKGLQATEAEPLPPSGDR